MITDNTTTVLQAEASWPRQKEIANYGISLGISLFFILMTVVCLYTPAMLFFKQLAANTLYVMFGLLFAGIIFLLFKMERLMIVSFICCAALCLHLKSSANHKMKLAAVTSSPALSVTHINLANAETNYDSVINYILGLDADVISFQELTPDWNAELTEKLSGKFEYFHTMTRLDQYGMGFFSTKPLTGIDTLYFNDIPSLTASITMDGGTVCNILSCQMIPPVNQNAFQKIDKHFSYLAEYMRHKPGGTIVLGDLHLPPWASEIQKFRTNSQLQDSRRDINPRNLDGSVSLPRIPVEHIFYCDKFECTSFSELGNEAIGRVGITGTYQLQGDLTVMAY